MMPKWWSLDRIYETEYSTTDRNGISQQTKYEYNSNNRLVNKITEYYPNTTIITNTKYVSDFSGQTFEKMKSRNLTGIPVEVITQKDGKIIGANKFEFDYNTLQRNRSFSATGSLLTTSNYSLYYEEDYTVEKFDTRGNPLIIRKKDGSTNAYLWSYDSQYPVAEIRNATYTQVRDVLGGQTVIDNIAKSFILSNADKTKIDNLRTNAGLVGSLVTTYTYKPFVGMLASTGPSGITTYYEYDSFNRLKRTYIKEGTTEKTVQTYDYHYQNQ
jgi:hypothetical protein